MSTPAQIEANRRNATKSTGPRSVSGKTASSRNALQSGVYAGAEVLRDEDPEQLAALMRMHYDSLRPATETECGLVDIIVRSSWLLRRFARIEPHYWEHELERASYPDDEHIIGQRYHMVSFGLERLQRRMNATHRTLFHAIRELSRLQKERRSFPIPEPPLDTIPQTVAPTSASTQIGFVPSNPSAPQPPAPQPAQAHHPALRMGFVPSNFTHPQSEVVAIPRQIHPFSPPPCPGC